MTGRFDKAAIAEVLGRVDLAGLAREIVPDLKRRGGRWWGRCPFHGERTASFTVWRAAGAQRFHCFGCGAGGDAIEFTRRAHGLDFPAAVAMLAGDAGVEADPARIAAARDRAKRAKDRADAREASEKQVRLTRAQQVWRAGVAGAGTIVETYLRGPRGIDLDAIGGLPRCLKFIPAGALARIERGWGWPAGAVDDSPAMLAPVQDISGALIAVHLTFLAADGSGKADVETVKRMIGPAAGGAIRFGPPARALGIAEGIESALSAWQMALEQPDLNGDLNGGLPPPVPTPVPGTARPFPQGRTGRGFRSGRG